MLWKARNGEADSCRDPEKPPEKITWYLRPDRGVGFACKRRLERSVLGRENSL